VNTKGVFLCCKHGITHLLERGGGSVINVASFVAMLGAATSQISYTASKGAVLSMSRELAVEFARQGVRVNALCPGPVETRSCSGSTGG
jgi:NAD(P)-dependent dehydrogenase (short-subunit alcohol dehydrogenase family)